MSAIIPRIDDRCLELGLFVSPPVETDRLHWELSYLWLTENGNWDDVPAWAKPFQNDNLGGDRHVYTLGFRLDGMTAKEADLFVLGWPDGLHKFSPKEEHECWGNVPINAGFDWGAADTGPYYAQMNAISSSIVRGIGLPYPPYPWHIDRKFKPDDPWPTMHVWDKKEMIGGVFNAASTDPRRTAAGEISVLGGLHTSFFLIFSEVEAYKPELPTPPAVEQFQRVLDKAERAADWLEDYQIDNAAAADIYLRIANVLYYACHCREQAKS